ncbi:MAG: hypothetical protein HY092_01340 [Candidatus Kerfeldbacteria bacterium]|nr:hypothetical protein [Candidatus Kerfeldbacteria bacterium]
MDIPPPKMSSRKFNDWLKAERKKCYRQKDGKTYCRNCGSEVIYVRCYVSLHATELQDCAGTGEVEHIGLEFCEKCETIPTDIVRSCTHDSMFGSVGHTFFGSQ